jgi:N-acetylmuramoyl-L-alanine amidase
MKICISSGHGLHIRGARGSPVPPELDEVDEARRVVDRVHQILTDNGVISQKFHDNTSYDQSTNLSTLVNWHNAQGAHDLDVSVHFNAYDGSAHGTEVLYVTQSVLAGDVSEAISDAGGFTNRGAKYRGDLYFLNNTREPAILIETCFCDNTSDSNKYNDRFEDICVAVAESIAGINIDEQPPIEPPIEPEPPDITELNYIEMKTASTGEVKVFINGAMVHGEANDQHVIDITLVGHGDVCMIINGEMFHNHPPQQPPEIPAANQIDIITTVFGGQADNEYSAYPPYDSNGNGPYLDDSEFYVALPWTVNDAGPNGRMVKVTNRANGKSETGWVGDKGPWFVDDNYPELGSRPLAETCYLNNEPCPRGPNEGVIPNGAGIDISPAMAIALGISGKGKVDWTWVAETS